MPFGFGPHNHCISWLTMAVRSYLSLVIISNRQRPETDITVETNCFFWDNLNDTQHIITVGFPSNEYFNDFSIIDSNNNDSNSRFAVYQKCDDFSAQLLVRHFGL